MLPSPVFDLSNAPVKSTQTGAPGQFFQSPTASLDELKCHTTILDAGQAPHSLHQHPEKELIVVTEGGLTAMVDDEKKKMSTGSMIIFACGQEHRLRNSGSVPAKYHVIRWRARVTR